MSDIDHPMYGPRIAGMASVDGKLGTRPPRHASADLRKRRRYTDWNLFYKKPQEWAAKALTLLSGCCAVGELSRLLHPVSAVTPAFVHAAQAVELLGIRQVTDIVDSARPWETPCGIYFLLKNGVITYVGQSVSVYARISQHATRKDFDSWAYIPCPMDHLDALESLYIHITRARENIDRNGNTQAPYSMGQLRGGNATLARP